MPSPNPPEPFVPIADIEVDAVLPGPRGFVLEGRGADAADYRLELELDIPVDRQTRTVLGELLAQSEWRISRRVPTSLRRRAQSRAETGRP